MNKNVLLISHFSNLSGAPISLAFLAKNLKQYGYNPVFSIPSRGQLEELLIQLEIPYTITGKFTSIYNLVKLIREKNISIVHANTIISAPGAIIARILGKKLIWHIREDISSNRIMARLVEKIADRIIILSQSMTAYFNMPNVSSRIHIVHNGVDINQFMPIADNEKAELRASLGIDSADRVVVVVGTIEPRKAQSYFIEAIKKLGDIKNVKYLIIGNALPGQGRYKRKLEKDCVQAGLNNILFIPARSDIPKILQIVDIVCVPSLCEPFGRVVVEGMAASKPVIGSNVGGIPEIILHKQTGLLISPGDSDSFSIALRLLLSDPILAQKYGRAGYERVLKLFSIEAHVKKIINIYEGLFV